MMLARTWRGATADTEARNYVTYLESTGLRGFAATAGNRGAMVLRRVRDGRAEFMVLSLWESITAVRRFAGERPDRAVFYPEDERFLVERDEHVDHFEVVFLDVTARSPIRRLLRRWWDRWLNARPSAPPEAWRLAAFR